MSYRLLSQIFRATLTNHSRPFLYKSMLNALPNNTSLLKNTTTSFYTILTSNLYRNHNLAKQNNALKASARLQSDINFNKQPKKPKPCKPTKQKTCKVKYGEIRINPTDDKFKNDMYCICMPISKFKDVQSKPALNEKELRRNADSKKHQSILCAIPSPLFCWDPPQKKLCPVQTWILSGSAKAGVSFFANKNKKLKAIVTDTKPLQSVPLMKHFSSTYYTPCNPSIPTNNYYAAQKNNLKKIGSTFNYAPSKQLAAVRSDKHNQPKPNMCPPKSKSVASNCASSKQQRFTNKPAQQLGSSSISAPHKFLSKIMKN